MAEKDAVEKLEYTLPRELDLLAAEALRAELLNCWQKDGSLLLDGGEVERVSTPCVEVLVAAANAFKESGRQFELSEPSASLCEAFDALGLGDRIELWRTS